MFRIKDPETNPDHQGAPFDWSRCVLCQEHRKTEQLINPANNLRNPGEGYKTLESNLPKFFDLGALPFNIDFNILNDGTGISGTLQKNNAQWHKSCYLKINNSKLLREQSKARNPQKEVNPSPKKTRSRCSTENDRNKCIICDGIETKSNPLRAVETEGCDKFLQSAAQRLKHSALLGKLSECSDSMALEVRYHKNCYTSIRNQVRNLEASETRDTTQKQVEALAFAGLVSFIDECREFEDDAVPAFPMSQLSKVYIDGLRELGISRGSFHSTRMKERLLEECPHLYAISKPGVETILTFRKDVQSVLRSLCSRDFDVDSRTLTEAAKIVRQDLFVKRNEERRPSSRDVHSNSVPPSMTALVKLILTGHCSSEEEGEDGLDLVAKNIAQLLSFHAVKRHRSGTARRRTNRVNETSIPAYLALKLYGETRKRKIVDFTYNIGMSISYDRLCDIVTAKANDVCLNFHQNGVVCPPSLLRGLFTTASVDNIDHNPTATATLTSFHGTAISLHQHVLPGESGGTITPVQQEDTLQTSSRRKMMDLPPTFSVVQPCFVDVKKADCPQSDVGMDVSHAENLPIEERSWLLETLTEQCTTWAAHYSKFDTERTRHSTKSALLPLFTEQAHSPSMMAHAMNVAKAAIKHLNPDQTPVLVADQPLFALLKQLQYQLPLTYGEDSMFIMMGGLHIEMAAMKALGQFMNGSGWVEALVDADVITEGRAESLISASHVTRTRYFHQVTLAALFSLQQEAYTAYQEMETDGSNHQTFEEWRLRKREEIPLFRYWDIVMSLESLVLLFVRAQRLGDFKMYITAIRRILPWFFALDHTNYARWMSIHLRDLLGMESRHPQLWQHFMNGLFVAQKSERVFSRMALDQAHEQLNALIKGDGGMIGLTENKDLLNKWMVAAPELAALIEEVEENARGGTSSTEDEVGKHHSDSVSAKEKFASDLKRLQTTLRELGNPFLEETKDLYNLYSKRVAPPEVVKTVETIEETGETQLRNFFEERLKSKVKMLYDPIKQNKLPLLTFRPVVSKISTKVSSFKFNCNLFRDLYIATSQHRRGDLDTFFAHENEPSPPSLAIGDEMRSCTKSDLVKCLLEDSPDSSVAVEPIVDCKIFDGAVVVNLLPPGQCRSFGEYLHKTFIPFTLRELSTVERIDFVWDSYDRLSLKNATRERRGTGERTRVDLSTKIPKSWPSFLRDSSNKQELFQLLAEGCAQIQQDGKEVYSSKGDHVVSNSGRDTSGILHPCNHEEADTRLMIHVLDAVAQGCTRILIRTVDTDVLVLAASFFHQIPHLEELWIHLGSGKNHQYVAAHAISESLGPEKANVLPMFHAFTGCDTVSSFAGRGKRTAYQAWKAYPDVTIAFQEAASGSIDSVMPHIEKFVVALYDRSMTCENVNECRKQLFTKKGRQIENLPPTYNALRQHTLRATYQGTYIWGQALKRQQELPSPTDYGWELLEGQWKPIWITMPIASQVCLELIRCGCKRGCSDKRCQCRKKSVKCTELCLCDAKCGQE